MNSKKHMFLRQGKPTSNLSSNALERIIARGLGQPIRREIAVKPVLPLVNSEAHILCSDIDVSSRNVAYGRLAIPKLKKELLSTDQLVSKRAILSLLDMVHDPERAVEAVRLQVIPRLVRLMLSEDPFVRQHILMILEVLGMQPHGKMAIVNHKFIMKNLATLLGDSDDYVRLCAAKTVLSLARWYLGVETMFEKSFIITLIQKLNTELNSEIMIPLLEALEFLLDQDMEAKKIALDNDGIELAALLEHSQPEIKQRAAAVIAQLSKHPDGKKVFLDHKADLIAVLTKLLKESDVSLSTHAVAALMFLMCTTEAKLRCLELQTPLLLVQCAHIYKHPGLQMNAIKALTSFAESPQGQNILKKNFQLIKGIRPADSIVRRHKHILITVINRVI